MRRTLTLIALTVLVWTSSSASTRADGNSIREALEALVPYDLEGESSFDALAQISLRIASEKDGKTRRGLRFVRAVALTDLWILAHKTSGTALFDRIARSMGIAREQVPSTLLSALDTIREPVVADIVRDARHALLLTWPEAAEHVSVTPIGPRTSVLFVDALTAAFEPERPTLAMLRMMAEDPCANAGACAELYRAFDENGRKAIRAVETALQAVFTLREVMASDPFVNAIAARVEANAALLTGLELAPSIALERIEERAHRTSQGSSQAPDIVAFMGPGKLEVSFVPRVRVTSAGAIELFAPGTPMLPSVLEVPFKPSFPLITRKIEELVAALGKIREQAPAGRIAIAARPDSPSHLWARALLSAKSAGFARVAMLGVGHDGMLRTQDVELVSALHAAEVGPTDLSVMVRLGGFTVQRTGASVSLPRLKNAEGFAFDYAGLASSARVANVKSTKLTFMSDVAADILAETAFMVAPQNNLLTVVLP